MTAYTKKIFGRAGTGKTYTLLKEIEYLLSKGVEIGDIAMVTHTNTAADVFKSRVVKQFGYNPNDLVYFSTMHSLSWRRQGLKNRIFNDNIRSHDMQGFLQTYYPDMLKTVAEYPSDQFQISDEDQKKLFGQQKIQAMIEIDSVLSGCMITDFDFNRMYKMTGRDLGYVEKFVMDHAWSASIEKYILTWGATFQYVSEDEQIEFSGRLREFLVNDDLYTHARNLEEMYASKMFLPPAYLFFDEFQDFSKLQYEIYKQWGGAPHIKQVVLAGDDAQTIQRFSSASPRFLIETPCDEVIKLGQTYRHGRAILNNAQPMLDHMTVVEPVDVAPADINGEVIKLTGDVWLENIDFMDPDEEVLVLAATKNWVRHIHTQLKNLFPNTVFVNIEDTRKADRVFAQYNMLAALERGETVPGVNASGEKLHAIEDFFKGSTQTTLPQRMFYMTPQTALFKSDHPKMTTVLKSVKAQIKRKEFPLRESYTKKTFEADFLKVEWFGRSLMNAIPDIDIFPQAPDVFPDFAPTVVKKRIGTIHKSKGDEADTVLLFMSIAQPALLKIDDTEIRDDVLRQFYVGKTRPRTKLIEVYDYLKYGNGNTAPSPLEMIQ